MRRPLLALLSLVPCLLPVACSSGGGGGGGGGTAVSATDWNGTWDIVATPISTTCGSLGSGLTATGDITVAADGLTARVFVGSSEVPVSGNRIQGYNSFNLTTYDLTLTSANAFTGTQTSNTLSCEITYSLVGTRSGGTQPAAFDWSGDWDISAVQSSTTCPGGLQFPPQSETITITLRDDGGVTTASFSDANIQIPIVDGRIDGYSSWNLSDYEFASTGPNSFAGTQRSTLPFSGAGGSDCEVVFAWTATRAGS